MGRKESPGQAGGARDEPPMNVLQVIPELDAGGAERTTIEIAEAIVAAGGRALVASQGGRLEHQLARAGGELITLPVKSKNPFVVRANAAKLSRIIEAAGVDIIHARSRAPAWSAYWAAKRADIAFVTTYHGTYKAQSGLKRWYNGVMARGDRVIANSEFIAERIRGAYGVESGRLRVIPRGVDLDLFAPGTLATGRAMRLREQWNIPAERAIVLLPGRLTAWKGQRLAIDAMAGLDADPAPVLVMAGDAQGRESYRKTLERAAAEAGVSIRLPGHVSDVAAAMAAADVVIAPSLEPEAFGRVAAEAMAMGAPVIAADHGGAREVVVDGETGWLSPAGDAEALSARIERALQLDAAARSGLARTARARAEALFSKTSLQEATLRVYRELLE